MKLLAMLPSPLPCYLVPLSSKNLQNFTQWYYSLKKTLNYICLAREWRNAHVCSNVMQRKYSESRTNVATILTQLDQRSDRYETCLSGRECHYDNPAVGCRNVALQRRFMSFPSAAYLDWNSDGTSGACGVRTGVPFRPDWQVQPTHVPINTDSKATRLSKVHTHFQLGHRTTLT
jgi:hypothetical protein